MPLVHQSRRVVKPDWHREWIADECPPHDCTQEGCWLDVLPDQPEYATQVCGVCGIEVLNA